MPPAPGPTSGYGSTNSGSVPIPRLVKQEPVETTAANEDGSLERGDSNAGQLPYQDCASSKCHTRNKRNKHQPDCRLCTFSPGKKIGPDGHKRLPGRQRSFRCKFCEITFLNRYDLKAHERTHTGERPFQCRTCHKGFSRMDGVRVHKRVHTGERPFQCDTCGATFVQRVI